MKPVGVTESKRKGFWVKSDRKVDAKPFITIVVFDPIEKRVRLWVSLRVREGG